MKKSLRIKRRFIGVGTCTGAVASSVSVRKDYQQKKYPGKYCMEAEIHITKEAKSHYIDCRKDMAAVYKMQVELDDFIIACEEALNRVEEHNATLPKEDKDEA